MHYYGDAIICKYGFLKPFGLLVVLQASAGKADIAAAFKHGLYAGA